MTTTVLHREKESKPRKPVDANHPIVAAAIRVLREQGGGPLASIAIFRRGFELGLFGESQYNTVRARLSQHCDLTGARVVRAKGSKIGVLGSRTTSWVLAETGLGLGVTRTISDGLLVTMRTEISPAKRRQRARARANAAHRARNLILTDEVLRGAPREVKRIAGRTAREALTSSLSVSAVAWLLSHLPLEATFRARLQAVADDAELREVVIDAEERRAARRA